MTDALVTIAIVGGFVLLFGKELQWVVAALIGAPIGIILAMSVEKVLS